ncbi:hypothetical protein GDO86_012953 [Hymenochirus boettgeri]|uniref:TTF-type domain-containing protein n=1 Tax=Hymenochirus boettgeri TaxID=247094 RepID=A0A8T2IUT8_9PIPI|nr:hypothetical protein GDO86_012953 [Hymenochirus boettgeri]
MSGRKRIKLSGAAYKKKRLAKEAALSKQKGAILKFLSEAEPCEDKSVEPLEPKAGCSHDLVSEPTTTVADSPGSTTFPILLSEESSSNAKETSLIEVEMEPGATATAMEVEQSLPEEEINEPVSRPCKFSPSLLRDPGLWMDMTNELRHFLVSNGPQQVNRFKFPKDQHKRGFNRKYYRRELPNSEITNRSWLLYSESRDAVFCFCCKIFPTNAAVSVLCTTGYNDWRNINRALANHEKADYHTKACFKWKDLETRLHLHLTIVDTNREQLKSETQHWRNVLTRLIILIRTLATQNIAFRGTSSKLHERNNGNFLKFVEAISEFDVVLEKHIKMVTNKETHIHYLGPGIQNEIINLLSLQIREKILVQLSVAKYYSIILDCTPDINHMEQMTLMVRFVTATEFPESGSERISIKEHFLSFIDINDTTGAGMTKVLLENLEALNIDIKDMRGQGYDNGSNMKGKNKGVQAQVRELNPRAFYVPCNAHSLNLVVSDAASCAIETAKFFNIIQSLYVFFSGSTHRWNTLKQHLSTNHQWLTLKPLSATRWESRIDAVKAVRNQIGKIDDALSAVMEDTTSIPNTIAEASVIQDNICNFHFLCGLVLWYDILFVVNITSKRLQGIEEDLHGAVEQLERARLYLRNYRSDEAFENVIKTAQNLAVELGIDGNFPPEQNARVRHKKRHFDYEARDEPIADPQQKFKVNFFYKVLDCVWRSLEDRFEQIKEHSRMFGFLYSIQNVTEISREEVKQQCDQLEKALSHGEQRDIDAADLCYELCVLSSHLPTNCNTPRTVLDYIYKNKMSSMFPNMCIALRILLTLPVTVASGERSFSKLKLIKTYLRSTMSQERLVGLATISIECELAHSLDLDEAIKAFASQKARRAPL